MSKNIKVEGYCGEIFTEVNDNAVMNYRSSHQPTKQDVINEFLGDVFQITETIVNEVGDTSPELLELIGDCEEADDFEAAYKDNDENIVKVVNTIIDWIKGEFENDKAGYGPFGTNIEGVILSSQAYLSSDQVAKIKAGGAYCGCAY
jgi:hypothetical protein